jgi:hypothetical protein
VIPVKYCEDDELPEPQDDKANERNSKIKSLKFIVKKKLKQLYTKIIKRKENSIAQHNK